MRPNEVESGWEASGRRTVAFSEWVAALEREPREPRDFEWWADLAITAFSVLLFIGVFGVAIAFGIAVVVAGPLAGLLALALPLWGLAVSVRALWRWIEQL